MAAQAILIKGAFDQKTKYFILAIFIILSLAEIGHAEPTSTIKFLMTEPLTLFDLGMYKLDKLINEDPFISATVKFDPENNKINITIVMYEYIMKKGARSSQNKREAFEMVESMVNAIRMKLGVNSQTGKIISDNTALEDCFRPANGRVIKNEPESLKEELFNMTSISVLFAGEHFNLNGKAVLKGTEIIYDN